MAPTITIVAGGVAAAYLCFRFILYVTQDSKEPPTVLTGIPFVSPLLSMFREKSHFYLRIRDEYQLPIYTLRLPFQRIYVVNATSLIPALQKQWRTISFAAIAADAGKLVGMSKEALKVMHHDLTNDNCFSLSWPKIVAPVMGPGPDLDEINRTSIGIFVATLDKLRSQPRPAKIGLWQYTRQAIFTATTESIYGPLNPYRDSAVAAAWDEFERGFLTFSVFPLPSLFFPTLYRARELAAAAMIEYMRKGGHEKASGLVRKRHDHHRHEFSFSLEDVARGELGNTFAVLGNTTPCALWVLWHIFSDARVTADIHQELSAFVTETQGTSSIDLACIRTSCPVLQSTFQEVLRFRALNSGVRVILEDVVLEGYTLKKGGLLMLPAPVQHTDVSAWGDEAREFDHLRFVRKPEPGRKKPNRVAFRAFGGGHVLCPGRHFASTEIMALAAILVLQFEVVPVEGEWVTPTWENSPLQAGFPVPDKDIQVELRPRDPGMKWDVSFSGSDEAIGIVSEDMKPE